jgi:alpha-glucosidase
VEHVGLTVETQAADPESNLAFARAMIAFRKASPALTVGALELLDVAEPVLGFVRRQDGEAVACLFNLSGEPAVASDPALEGAILLDVPGGEADVRGASVGLAPWAAAFLRLA